MGLRHLLHEARKSARVAAAYDLAPADTLRFERLVPVVQMGHPACSVSDAEAHLAYWVERGRELGYTAAVSLDVAARDSAYGHLRDQDGNSPDGWSDDDAEWPS